MIRGKKFHLEIIYTIIIAFIIQNYIFYLGIKDSTNGIFDYYVLNIPYRNMTILLMVFLLPLFVCSISGGFFCKYRGIINTTFTRQNKAVLIFKDLFFLTIKNFLMTIFLFFMCFVFLMIFYVIVNPQMNFATTLDLNMYATLANPSLYGSNPILYLAIYALYFATAAAVCTLLGYLISLFIANKYIVTILPFVIWVVFTLVSDGISFYFLSLFSFLQMLQLNPKITFPVSPIFFILIYFIGLFTLIVFKIRKGVS